MELYERVKDAVAAAKAKGVTVAAIAKACSITRQAVYQWMEIGANSIDGANLVELAELSGYNARWIANGRGPQTKGLSPDQQVIFDAWQLLDEETKDGWILTAKRKLEKASKQTTKAA